MKPSRNKTTRNTTTRNYALRTTHYALPLRSRALALVTASQLRITHYALRITHYAFPLFLLLSLLPSCTNNRGEKTLPASEVLRQRDSLLNIINSKDQELNSFMSVFTEVQDGLIQVSEAEGRVVLAESDIEMAGNRDIVRENMEFIRQTIASKQQQIEQLSEQLKRSTIGVEKMQKALENLRGQVEAQNIRIQQLELQLAERDSLIARQGQDLSTLRAQSQRQEETVAAQDRTINEAYFVYGTKTELKNQHILDNGEVLTRGDFNREYFAKIDIRIDKQIKLYSKSATIKTNHPAGSYTLTKDSKGEYVLNILRPNDFWSTSRYLVVLVK